MFKKVLAGLAVAGLLSAPALAHHVGDVAAAGTMKASHAWTPQTSAMAHAVEVYLTITNEGEEADRLVAAATDFTQDAVFQAPLLGEDGTLKVREVAAIELAPGQQITFQPGGLVIVLNDVKQVLTAGDEFHLDLTFEKAGFLEVEVVVEEPRAPGAADS